jgi:hypothetical protein
MQKHGISNDDRDKKNTFLTKSVEYLVASEDILIVFDQDIP